jgi:hypothetical protein
MLAAKVVSTVIFADNRVNGALTQLIFQPIDDDG